MLTSDHLNNQRIPAFLFSFLVLISRRESWVLLIILLRCQKPKYSKIKTNYNGERGKESHYRDRINHLKPIRNVRNLLFLFLENFQFPADSWWCIEIIH